MEHTKTSLVNYVKKKGIQYFIQEASEEDKRAFEGILFRKGYPNIALLQSLMA